MQVRSRNAGELGKDTVRRTNEDGGVNTMVGNLKSKITTGLRRMTIRTPGPRLSYGPGFVAIQVERLHSDSGPDP